MTRPSLQILSVGSLALLTLSGCALRQIQQEQDATLAAADRTAALAQNQRPIVEWHPGAWLMGEETVASRPQPAIYDKPVDYTYRGGSLEDLARWLRMTTGAQVAIDPSVTDARTSGSAAFAAASARSTYQSVQPPLPGGVPTLPGLNAPLPAATGASPLTVSNIMATGRWQQYVGSLGGLLKREDARFGVWDKYQNGVITFFKTETRYFQLPTIDDNSHLDSTLSTSAGSSGNAAGAGGGSMGGGGATQSSSSATGAGNGQTSSLHADIEPFKQIEQTATAIANGGKVVADKNLGMLVVTGTPPQCDAVEAFMKTLNATFGKNISFDVHLYTVQLTREENYGANLSLAYKSATGHTSASIAGAAAPTVTGDVSGLTFGANILSGPFAGSQGTVKLLSTLGRVVGDQSLPGIAPNGKKVGVTRATMLPYLPSVQSSLAANVGSSSSAQGAFLPLGFTAQVLPYLAYGSIRLDVTATVTRLISMMTLPAGCQPNTGTQGCLTMPYWTNFDMQGGGNLKPGETLLLVGLSEKETSTQNNGVGSPFMTLLGGGIDGTQSRTLYAVAVTARVL
ncbi:pilus assembly protein PilN [Burkholderia glumae]|uniref:pilus assembly protein PilN n=1 Tax=Burkholderia glumae TaxID=337 RepID=UPI0020CD4249|nr:pilus assembly protein PilN [Burkholderia glumae]MCQ0031469.1 pilus assembly protein PilN [Burkholderia glumae]MCQ0035121.1 pilus assembly protein PilN [Burkholderia glumae]